MVRALVYSLISLLAAGASVPAKGDDANKDAKGSTVVGTFVSYKAEILTLKAGDKEREFNVPADTAVAVLAGDDKKLFKAGEYLRDLKEGATVAVTLGPGGKVLGVGVIAGLPKKPA